MSRKRSRSKLFEESEEEILPTPRPKTAKLIKLNLMAASALPYIHLTDPTSAIKHFFASPLPFFYGNQLDGMMLEIELRKLVGAPVPDLADCIGRDQCHPEMHAYIRKYDSQISSSPLEHDYELLSVTTEEEEAEMQRLAALGFQAVLRPWGKLALKMETEWIFLCKDVYDKKEYLAQGIYATEPAIDMEKRERFSDFGFSWPLPQDNGLTLLDDEKDFRLPHDIERYLNAIGGEEWLESRGSGMLIFKCYAS